MTLAGALTEYGDLERVFVRHAADAFASAERVGREWRDLGFTAPPDLARALKEHDAFLELLAGAGAAVDRLPPGESLGLDAVYVRDASIVSARGVILCRMGKPQRAAEPEAQRAALEASGIPIAGAIEEPGRLEGGDVVWLDPRTIAVGRGYRTNAEGIRQLRALLGDTVDELIEVPLPHWRGPGDVFHLMSIVSPVDRDLAVVYAPLLPVPFRERLLDFGMKFVEVPDEEFPTMAANVLAVAPRRCVALDGNPRTRALLERAGAEVLLYAGEEISRKGSGGPTCLTRPVLRSATR